MKDTQYFERLWNSFKVILKEPQEVGRQFLESGDFILGIGFIVAEMLCSGLFFLIFGFRLNLGVMNIFGVMSLISAKHIGLLAYFGIGIYTYALDALILFAIMYFFSKMYQNQKIKMQDALILVSLQAIFDIPVTLAATGFSILSSVIGIFIFITGKLLGIIVVSKLYKYEDEDGSEKSSYIVFSIYGASFLAKGILDIAIIALLLK